MKQFGFCLKIKPEMKEEYKDAHDKIWPEFVKVQRNAGLKNQSIFYREDGTLFLYFESANPEKSLKEISDHPLNIKWQKEMERFFIKDNRRKKTESSGSNILSKTRPEVEILELIYQKD